MALTNFRKETSERSDSVNWAKSLLSEKSGYFLESIEGCNQNAHNVVTNLIERARVDFDATRPSKKNEIISAIIALEGRGNLERKINFARCFGLPVTYALYCDENQNVYLFQIKSLEHIELIEHFKSYNEFAQWIAKVKGWKSTKPFREQQDLPFFDRELRKAGTPWPTNIDCFICDNKNRPIAILEFQNAKNTSVAQHCNNDYFLCKMSKIDPKGRVIFHDDIRRWTSQEILRVQSQLRLFIITWSQSEDDIILKEVEKISIPYFHTDSKKLNAVYMHSYKTELNNYITKGKEKLLEENIAKNHKTYNLIFST